MGPESYDGACVYPKSMEMYCQKNICTVMWSHGLHVLLDTKKELEWIPNFTTPMC